MGYVRESQELEVMKASLMLSSDEREKRVAEYEELIKKSTVIPSVGRQCAIINCLLFFNFRSTKCRLQYKNNGRTANVICQSGHSQSPEDEKLHPLQTSAVYLQIHAK